MVGALPRLDRSPQGAIVGVGQCLLLDTGANVEVKPFTLAQFAVLGATFAKLRATSPRLRPRVGLLSNGEEASKGTALLRQTHALLQASSSMSFEYVGYVEGRDLFQYRRPPGQALREGGLDVVVTDGFTGNVVLKTAEGAGRFIADLLRSEVKRSLLAKLGALLMMPALNSLKRVVDVDGRGGAPLLGVNGVAIICHGRASARARPEGLRRRQQVLPQQRQRHTPVVQLVLPQHRHAGVPRGITAFAQPAPIGVGR